MSFQFSSTIPALNAEVFTLDDGYTPANPLQNKLYATSPGGYVATAGQANDGSFYYRVYDPASNLVAEGSGPTGYHESVPSWSYTPPPAPEALSIQQSIIEGTNLARDASEGVLLFCAVAIAAFIAFKIGKRAAQKA